MKNRGQALREPAPFLKWAGGKRQILPDILRRMPERCGTYHEPFLGGGAVFFALAARGTFRRAVLGDRNADLIDAYLGVRDDVERVIARLARMPHDRFFYERLRAADPRKLSGAQRAARIIYLNRTCYNGLYRVNRAGQFNVPFGRYENPRILDRENLRAASRALRGAVLGAGDFETVLARARPGDVVYFDPPYVPLSATASFTAYDREAFGPEEQRRLARVMEALRRRGVYALLSNSDVSVTRALYRDFPFETVRVRRAINSRGDRRGPIPELLVRTLPEYGGLPSPTGRRTPPPLLRREPHTRNLPGSPGG